jgi:hypothetical protein
MNSSYKVIQIQLKLLYGIKEYQVTIIILTVSHNQYHVKLLHTNISLRFRNAALKRSTVD